MGLQYQRRVPLGRHFWLNLSGRGLSVGARAGRVSANTRGRWSVRLFRGLFYRG